MNKGKLCAFIVVLFFAAFMGLVVWTAQATEAPSTPTPPASSEKPAEPTPPVSPEADASDLPVLPDVIMTLALAERTLGDSNAPIKVIEYASMTCSHCAHFHNTVFSDVKKEFIDTGKIHWTMRDFPLDNMALKAAMMARCAPKENYFNLVEVIFANQQRWISSDDQLDALKKLGKLAGLSDEGFDACMKNKDLEVEMLKRLQEGQTRWSIKATPTFVFNLGEVQFSGGQHIDEFRKTVDKIMQAKGK